MIGIVTDSNSQLPDELAQRYGVEVVPLTVTVDGVPHAEGIELSADDFYARFDSAAPEVSTAAPAPGAFAAAYERLAERGAGEILSIHIGSAVSGTLNSARVAASAAPVPVRLVDTGTASFGVSVCVWEAAEVLAAGGSTDEAAAVAERMAPEVANVFVVRALELVRAGGRLAAGALSQDDAVPVLSLIDGQITVVDEVGDLDAGVDAMVAYCTRRGGPVRAAVGFADTGAVSLAEALRSALGAHTAVAEVVGYRIGPSVGVHTGPGTAGCFFWPC